MKKKNFKEIITYHNLTITYKTTKTIDKSNSF